MTKLCDICDFQGGSQPPKEEWSFEEKEGYVRMLQIRDFTQSEKVTPEYIKVSSSTKMCKEDDILIARYGASIGKILTGLAGAYNVAIMKTIPDTSKIEKRYLYYYLKSSYFQNSILNVGSRAAQAGFNKEDLSKLEINCPKIEVQLQIVSVLDKVGAIINKRKKELEELDNLIKSRFVEMFGDVKTNKYSWEKCKFGDVTTKITDGEHGTVPRVEKNEGILYFMARNITKEGTIDLSETSYVPEDVHRKIYKRCNPEEGDILLVCVGATIGKATIVPPNMKEFSIARSVALLKPDREKVNSTFLINLLKSDIIQNDISNCAHAAAQAGLYTNMIINLNAFVPPKELQKQFATFVNQVDKLKFEVQKSLDETQTLMDSLMQQYFG